ARGCAQPLHRQARPRRHTQMMRLVSVVAVMALAGCGGERKDDASKYGKVPAYIASSSCSSGTATSCKSLSGCEWVALGIGWSAGTTCPSGACVETDPCKQKTTIATCAATNNCAWSQM